MNAPASLIAELESAIRTGSQDKRIETLRRVSDLFFARSDRLNEEQLELFDDVLGRMIIQIEERALAQLSGRMADVANAPVNVVRTLARHENIDVAAPVLKSSPRLSEHDLIEIAETRGQSHLVAISSRPDLREPVTDVLIRRGDAPVFHQLAANASAKFSEGGFQTLVASSKNDSALAEKVGTRPDIPPHLHQQLLMQATEQVRRRLLDSASPETRRRIDDVLAGISVQMGAPARDYAAAEALIAEMKAAGALTRSDIAEFARAGRHEQVVAALAAFCGAPLDMVATVFETGRYDAVLIICKAAGLDWPGARLLLQKRPENQVRSDHDLDRASQEYEGLTERTAQRVLRFWQVRQTVKDQAQNIQ